MSVVAVIPARGGSVRIPNKNIRDFHGRPIISYSIDVAQRSCLFDQIFVSTDSDEIARVAERYGAGVIWRDVDDGSRGTQDVMREAMIGIDGAAIGCCIYATCPLLTVRDLTRGHEILRERHVLYSMSVTTDPLADAGQFYWGAMSALIHHVPLIDTHTAMIPVNDTVDINIEADWQLAEQLYIDLRGSR